MESHTNQYWFQKQQCKHEHFDSYPNDREKQYISGVDCALNMTFTICICGEDWIVWMSKEAYLDFTIRENPTSLFFWLQFVHSLSGTVYGPNQTP